MKELTLLAAIENIETITDFVNENLEALDCPMKIIMQVDVAIDEIVSNIARYAYHPEDGMVNTRIEVEKEPLSVIITFMDNGEPFDPLKRADPNTNLPLENREVGGLGIYLTKKIMDDITYTYQDGKNILSIRKNI